MFRYLDARKYLADAFEYSKRLSPAFSHRFVAKAMNASSSGFFKDILNGRISISPARAAKFARLFKMPANEAAHFETLVLYTQADSTEEKERLLGRLSRGSGGHNHVLEAFQLEYFKKWHYAAVREILAFEPVRDIEGDFARIAALLEPALTPAEVHNAIGLLLKLKLIRKNAQGVFERADQVIRSGRMQNPVVIKPAIRGNIELALRALERQPAAIRPFSYLTLSVSESSLAPIREKIATMRREILEIAAQDEHVDRLIQLNVQMFPLTQVSRKTRQSASKNPSITRKTAVKTKTSKIEKSTRTAPTSTGRKS